MDARSHAAPPGSTPGIESIANLDEPPTPGTVRFRCIDYGPEHATLCEPATVDELLGLTPPPGSTVRWINVDGLHPHVVNRLRQEHHFHTLAAEDVLRVGQRPKVEEFDAHLFIVVPMLMLRDDHLVREQVSLFLFPGLILTFQELHGDVWEPVRQRLHKPGSRLRTHDASYLLYALLDATVDHCFPILEVYGQQATPAVQRQIYRVKRELSLVRRAIWPTREVINFLQRPETEEVADSVKTYMRDVYDHTVQVMDIVETHREMAGGLNDLYMSAVSNRMNEIMKVLTIMASFFIPITFLAGVYGMNFEHIPELHWIYGYGVFWGVVLLVVAGMTVFFVRKGWIGGGARTPEPDDDPDDTPSGR